MTDADKAIRVALKSGADRLRLGSDHGFHNNRSRTVNDADRGLFHADIQSGKILHGCPPRLLGALAPPRITSTILGDSHPLAHRRNSMYAACCWQRTFRRELKPDYAVIPAAQTPPALCARPHTLSSSRTIAGDATAGRTDDRQTMPLTVLIRGVSLRKSSFAQRVDCSFRQPGSSLPKAQPLRFRSRKTATSPSEIQARFGVLNWRCAGRQRRLAHPS